jgi:hypothetical protein
MSIGGPSYVSPWIAAESDPSGRTKYKAEARWQIAHDRNSRLRLGDETKPEKYIKPSDVSEEDVAEYIALRNQADGTHETRPDRRFPNVNQSNNCWCVL